MLTPAPQKQNQTPSQSKKGEGFFFQPKLTINQPNDVYEQEADAVADNVMRMPETSPSFADNKPFFSPPTVNVNKAITAKEDLHKKENKEEETEEALPEIQAKPSFDAMPPPPDDNKTDEAALIQRKCAHCEKEKKLQRKQLVSSIQKKEGSAGAIASDGLTKQLNSSRGGGGSIESNTKSFMQSRFGNDFSDVKIHTGGDAIQMNRELNAKAFTIGNDIYFNEGQYNPSSNEGKHLLAHELTHKVQQGGISRVADNEYIQRYTEAERREMAERRVTGQAADITMASQRHFEPGDIVFRLGSTALGLLMGEPVTHGGIYIGNGLIHDVVGFGNRNVRVTNFFNPALGEAANASTYRVVRFRGPLRDLIITRLLVNINAGNFRLPTDPVPFNLFSTADDYRTATCLEYSHAQFLHAIHQLSLDPAVSAADRQTLRLTYFRAGAAMPSDLIRPTEQRLIGNMPDPNFSTMSQSPGMPPPRTPSALMQSALLVGAASALATDVDPTRFANRDESVYTQHWPGGSGIRGSILNFLMGPSHDEVVLRTFTYQSFIDSRQFFTDVTAP